MNVLLLHSSSDLYGAGKILLTVVRILKKHGHTPVVVLSQKGLLSNQLQEENIKVVFVHLGIIRRKYLSFKGLINRLAVIKKSITSLKKIIQENNINIVYSNTTAVLSGIVVARKLHIKHIWHVHEIIEQPKFFSKFISYFLKKSNDIIAVSQAVKNHWQQYLPDKKIDVIYNGIDYAPFLQSSDILKKELKLSDDKIVMGTIGRVHFWKGQDYFLRIAGELSKQYNNLVYVMIGDAFPGYEFLYEKLKTIKEEENISDVVYDLGFRKNVNELIQNFDIFIMPSIQQDPFPTVILEAMAASKAVVATNIGGAVEMIKNNETGILIPHNDVAKAAKIISHLISNPDLIKQIETNAKRHVLTNFSLALFEEKIIKYFE